MSNFDTAAAKTSFQLSYKKSRVKRKFHADGLNGEKIFDAFNPGMKAPGDWVGMNWDTEAPKSEAYWHEQFWILAIMEVVHECAESYRVDQKLFIDPHGKFEHNITSDCEKFAKQLAKKYGRKM